MNKTLRGKTICGGFAIGKIRFLQKEEFAIVCENITDIDEEIERYETAGKAAALELSELYEKALSEVGMEYAQIFEAQSMILTDEEYNAFVRYTITTLRVSAEYAVKATCEHFVAMFLNMDDEYFRARSVDVKDVSGRLLRILGQVKSRSDVRTEENSEQKKEKNIRQEPYIVMAEELTPSETVLLEKQSLQGIVTHYGTSGSHTAILADTMNIPALSHIDVSKEWDGKTAIIDGFTGELILEPDAEVLELYRRRIGEEREKAASLSMYKGTQAVDSHGRRIFILANIGDVSDLAGVLENDAEGIGLFRSEMMYLKGETYPTEEELFQVYKQVLEEMDGKKVIIRTIDMGGDKKVDYFGLIPEENPALGCRGIRISLTREAVFRTQLRAMMRAAEYGNLAIMYPMITSVWEVRKIKEIVEEVKTELRKEGIPLGLFEQGIMIETPAAAIISDQLAAEVDFFSIGTNDLTQYTLAVDRQNSEMECFYDAHHEAVMRLIHMTINNAHKAGITVGICGELAADTSLTEDFLQWGIDELSVVPGKVLALRKVVMDFLHEKK